MTPSGAMLRGSDLVAENLHRKLKEYHQMNVSPLQGILLASDSSLGASWSLLQASWSLLKPLENELSRH